MTLREVLEAAADAAGVGDPSEAADGSLRWAVGDTVFATLDAQGATAAFHLDPVLVGAAARTPDASADPAGPDWVRFVPADLDGHAADRASAWFAAAFRRAGA